MPVTPIDLQVLFMQEGRAARELDRSKKFSQEMGSFKALLRAHQAQDEQVKKIETTELTTVDGEKGGGNNSYYNHRKNQDPNQPESKKPTPDAKDPDRGRRIDLKI